VGDIAPALGSTWARAQVDSHLKHLLYWFRKGYPLSDHNRQQITMLHNMIAGEEYAKRDIPLEPAGEAGGQEES
jgi:hypothetical protein